MSKIERGGRFARVLELAEAIVDPKPLEGELALELIRDALPADLRGSVSVIAA